MKVRLFVLGLVAAACGCASGDRRAADAAAVQAASTYRSPDGRFTVSVPAGWKVVPGLPGTIAAMMPEATPPGTIVLVSFGRQPLDRETPDSLIGFEREAFGGAQSLIGPMAVRSSEDATLSGLSARRVEFTARPSGSATQEVQVFAFTRNEVLTANYCATTEFDRHRSAAAQAIASARYAIAD